MKRNPTFGDWECIMSNLSFERIFLTHKMNFIMEPFAENILDFLKVLSVGLRYETKVNLCNSARGKLYSKKSFAFSAALVMILNILI